MSDAELVTLAVMQALLDLERHGGRTPAGVRVRILKRILALTAAIWHTTTPTPRSTAH